MTALIIVLSIVFLFFILFVIPVNIRIKYNDTLICYAKVLIFKFSLYPRRHKLKSMSKKKYDKLKSGKKKDKKKKKRKKSENDTDAEKTEKKTKMSFSDIIKLVRDVSSIVKKILERFNKYLKVKIYSFVILISADDASKTALTYGAVSGSVGTLMRIIEDRCNVKYSPNAETGIVCDYIAGSCDARIDMRFSLRVWQIVVLAFKALISFIKIKSKTEVIKNAGNEDK